MVGGKWTTYRAFAEETVDLVLADLGLARKASTRDLAIGGGADYSDQLAADLVAQKGLAPERAAYLVDLYGACASTVAAFCAEEDRSLPDVPMSEGEVTWAIRHEQALHLADVLQRRSPLAIRGLLSLPLVTAVAKVMATECGWTEDQTQSEITRFLSELETWHGVTLTPPEGAHP
jgi:glycerol-3-phosphate dehydrogenase